MTSSDPDVIRQQIEDTRANLSYDVDALNEKVNPARVVDRRVTRTKDAVGGLRNRIMGESDSGGGLSSASDSVKGAASNAAGTVSNAASSAVDTVSQTPDAVISKTQGNPLAAGLIAFGVGWLVSSLLPTTEKEKQLASQAETAVKEHSQPLVDAAKQASQEAAESLKPAAQDAFESVKGTAQEAVQTVKDDGQSAAGDVQGQAQQARENVQGASSS